MKYEIGAGCVPSKYPDKCFIEQTLDGNVFTPLYLVKTRSR